MINVTLAAALSLALTACTTAPAGPDVRLVMSDDSTVPADYLDGARAWDEIGYVVAADDSGAPECPRAWAAERVTDCQITIAISVVPNLVARAGTSALSNRAERTIAIDPSLDQFGAMIALAHETGHIILDTAEHTRGGVMGGADWRLAAVDRELACRVVALGCG